MTSFSRDVYSFSFGYFLSGLILFRFGVRRILLHSEVVTFIMGIAKFYHRPTTTREKGGKKQEAVVA